MHQNNIIYLFVFVGMAYANNSHEKPQFHPNLPSGEYRIALRGVIRCVPLPKRIQLNLYINKKSISITEFKGNVTALEPIDDSLSLDIGMTVKDSIGGWKDNVFNHKIPNGCNGLKKLLGHTSWSIMLSGLGYNNTTCPIPVGVYTGTGVDLSYLMHQADIPKMFFYGTYKLRISFSKNNEVYGCIIFIIDVLRPWE